MNILKGRKTQLFSVAVLVLGLLETFDPEILGLDADIKGYVTIGIAIAVYILRSVTASPMGKKL